MLTKTINVSGAIKIEEGFYANISFNYKNNVSEINNIDFNFNKNLVNVFGTYNVAEARITNYNVNNGIIEPNVLNKVEALVASIAKNPDNPELYEDDDEMPEAPKA